MIDIHTHIIPGVDDGSPTAADSLEMLRIAQADGTKAMVATPHVFHTVSKLGSVQELKAKFLDLKKMVREEGISLEILPGAEVFFVSDLKEKIKYYREGLTINGSDYFLLEFPPHTVFTGSREYIFDIVSEGLVPIICHPERNGVFQEEPQLLYELLQAGALTQVNAGSFKGEFGYTVQATALKLLKNNLVHVIASDCHGPKDRPPGLSSLYKKLRGFDSEKIDMLVESIPLAIVNNNPLPDIGPPGDPEKKSTFFERLFK